jgi:hypothetical protein
MTVPPLAASFHPSGRTLLKPMGHSCPIDMQNRKFRPYLTTMHRILVSGVVPTERFRES